MMTRSKTRVERKRELDEEIAKAADRRRKTGKASSSIQHEEKSLSTLEVKMMTRSKTRAERKRKLEEEIANAADRRRETGKESSSSTQNEEKSLTVNPLLNRYLQRGTLLPGIPDDVTTQVLSTVLPWNAFHTLSSVSNAWHKSIQSGEMSEARVRFNSTDKLAVIKHCLQKSKTYGIAVYSFRDKAFYPLPQIPGIESGIPESCKCTTLDGKIYILGGLSRDHKTRPGKLRYRSSDVYMLDVVGQRPWKKCASMQAAGRKFGFGIIDGKIYVCGGSPHRTHVKIMEVYDPKEDAWTEVEPMPVWGTENEFAVLENELWVFGERASWQPGFWQRVQDTFVQIYNPARDEWRRLPPRPGYGRFGVRFFMAKGKLHSMTSSKIFVHDHETNSRTLLHTVSKTIDGPAPHLYLSGVRAVAAIGDELLAIHSAGHCPGDCSMSERSHVVVQSRGFGIRDKEIIWERVGCSLDLEGLWPHFICPLQL
ncbi:unnamed protein product [Calypogeia fissa]